MDQPSGQARSEPGRIHHPASENPLKIDLGDLGNFNTVDFGWLAAGLGCVVAKRNSELEEMDVSRYKVSREKIPAHLLAVLSIGELEVFDGEDIFASVVDDAGGENDRGH